MAYIRVNDIVDELIKPIVAIDGAYLTRAENAYKELANSFGIPEASIKIDPLPFVAKEFLKAYVGWEVCFNNAGLDDKLVDRDSVENDVYMNKLGLYEKRLSNLQMRLNKDIILGRADTPEEYSYSMGRIFRS